MKTWQWLCESRYNIWFWLFDFDLLHLTSGLQSKASSKPESSSDSNLESESMMLFGLQKFPLIVDLLFLVRFSCLLLPLWLNDANELFEQLLEEISLFSDEDIAGLCSSFSWGIGKPSFIMAAWQLLLLGIIFILNDFVMQRKIGCMSLVTISLGLRVVEYFLFYLNF